MNVRRHGGRRYQNSQEFTLGKTDFYVQNFLNLMPLGASPALGKRLLCTLVVSGYLSLKR